MHTEMSKKLSCAHMKSEVCPETFFSMSIVPSLLVNKQHAFCLFILPMEGVKGKPGHKKMQFCDGNINFRGFSLQDLENLIKKNICT